MALTLNIGKCTLLGNYRENNEDSIEVKQFPDMVLSIVADGMGGQAAGEVASRCAVDAIPRELRRLLPSATNVEDIKAAIRKAVVKANEEIISIGLHDAERRNMGTTVVLAAWRRGQEMFITNVGDSRAYLIRNGKITQLTIDHSLAEALVQAKTISPEEAKNHRFSHVLWKYLGTKEVGQGPEVHALTVQPGDLFLLCSDGLSGAVSDEQLLAFVSQHTDVQECADGLGQFALESGSRDNVSCILIEVAESR